MKRRDFIQLLFATSIETDHLCNTRKEPFRSRRIRFAKLIALVVGTSILLTFGASCAPRAPKEENQTNIQTQVSETADELSSTPTITPTLSVAPTVTPTPTQAPTPSPTLAPTPTPIPSPTQEPTTEPTSAPETTAATETTTLVETAPLLDYVLNTNTMKFHKPSCGSVDKIKPENRTDVKSTRDDVIAQGYNPCGNCNP